MIERLQRVPVPATEQEDINREFTTWRDGKCVALDEGTHVTVFILHESVKIDIPDPEIEGAFTTQTVTYASPIRVPKPLTRDMAINAAEMQAYSLRSAMEVASFAASMSRKHRLDPTDPEVLAHDSFITTIKEELTKVGV